MATCCARCDFNDREERVMMEETCPVHEGARLPCVFNHDEVVHPRTFESVINEWTDTVLKENRTAPSDLQVLALILRLGVLGQRLIYEANDIGMRQVMAETKERLGL